MKYPIGKSRVENLSVLVFSVIMGLAAVFLLYSSVLVLTNGSHALFTRTHCAHARMHTAARIVQLHLSIAATHPH